MDQDREVEFGLQGNDEEVRKMIPKYSEYLEDGALNDMKESKTKGTERGWKYKEGWPEATWEKEFDRHPFFMKEAPDPALDLHPLLEGLQHLKYGYEDNTAEEVAEAYKNDGLFSFRTGKYKDAILNFTEGLKHKCSNELKSQLYNNRAASHFFMSNYRSSLRDSQEAIKLNPNYTKAKLRIPQCLFHLGCYDECIDHCKEILNENEDNVKIAQLLNTAEEKKKLEDEHNQSIRKKSRQEMMLIKAIRLRNIRIKIEGQDLTSSAQLEVPAHPPGLQRVRLEEYSLIWSAIIVFPGPEIYDCVNSFHENITFTIMLKDIFEANHSAWDTKKEYTENTVNLYFKDEHSLPIKFSIKSTLLDVQRNPRYYQDSSVLRFYILVKDSASEEQFLEDCYRGRM